jgi:hypothetical protein
MMMADGAEHRIQMPDAAATSKAAAAPEKWLNYFVRLLAVIESVGNAFGTLAFTWATVVLLGGYPTVLGSHDDFWYATAIVFLEAVRYICNCETTGHEFVYICNFQQFCFFCVCGNLSDITITSMVARINYTASIVIFFLI